MRKSRFSEEQNIKVLKEHAAGRRQVICAGRELAPQIRTVA
ncbi:hypothetical protein [Bradyrhizobium septentrionale]|nr:hypothetical protein [Bradyrhizobium septentrionale]